MRVRAWPHVVRRCWPGRWRIPKDRCQRPGTPGQRATGVGQRTPDSSTDAAAGNVAYVAGEVDERRPEERELLVRSCRLLTPQDLAEVLKWPFCVGEAEQILLAELERQLTEKSQRPISFGGDVWKFVAQGESSGSRTSPHPPNGPVPRKPSPSSKIGVSKVKTHNADQKGRP